MKKLSRKIIRSILNANTYRGSIETGWAIWISDAITLSSNHAYYDYFARFKILLEKSEIPTHPIEHELTDFQDRINDIVEYLYNLQNESKIQTV